ncbi:DHHC palmitoyltransferase-domain-containing protein [Amylocystis lapponica]|nr:DHHC palmitoyltransferase-domain-containing protein [Amylocystis lapponica]
MANIHSLPSTPTRSTHPPLPFSPSSNPVVQRIVGGSSGRSHSGSTSSNAPPTLSGSTVSARSRPQPNMSYAGDTSLPSSTSLPLFHPRPASNMTHAGGILPSASFFHPSRPSYPPPSPPPSASQRPSSIATSVVSAEAPQFDSLRLSTLSERHSRDSEDGTDSSEHSTEEEVKEPTLAPSVRSIAKPSREPLLPIGPGSRPPRRPSVITQGGPYGRSESNLSAGSRVRDSFERIFKRRFSFEGSTKSPASAGPSSAQVHAFAQVQPPPGEDAAPPAGQLSPAKMAQMFELNVPQKPLRPPPSPKHSLLLSPLHRSASSFAQFAFVPTPPQGMQPLLWAVPVVDPQTGKPVRKWQLHPSRNRFFLDGRLMTGGDSPWAFIASLTVVLGISGIYFGTTCVWWWHHESPAVAVIGAYMCLLTISSMFVTAFRDPGILPRNLDPDPPFSASASSDSLRAPLPRDLKVRSGVVRTKFCITCRTYRPPRSSHCKMCDNCVDGCDHHCQWVNNCVGHRNYSSFFTFLFSAVTTLVLVICTTALHLYLLTRNFGLSFRGALSTPEGTGSAIAFMMSLLVIWPVLALLAYHLRLLLLNVTTIEQIRNQAHKSLNAGPPPPNAFSHGNWRRNMLYMLCRPAGSSWLDARGFVTEDKREVNPGRLREADAWLEDGRGRGKGE